MKGINLVFALSPKIYGVGLVFMRPILLVESKIQRVIGSKDLTTSTL